LSKPAARKEARPIGPPCPQQLNAAARAEWDRIVPQLVALDVINTLDLAVLAVYCNSCAAWADAISAINKFGEVIKTHNGNPIQSPYVSIANKHAETMLRCCAELGLTPAARQKLFKPKSDLDILGI
jgi:P27 family predicted phage terminase small subunit